MTRTLKIISLAIVISSLMITSQCVYAQSKSNTRHKTDKRKSTIGFQTGREVSFSAEPTIHGRQSKMHSANNNKIVLRKPINGHFKAEAGLSYSAFQNGTSTSFSSNSPLQKVFKFSLPITLQYYFLPEKSKVRPYCGAGLQYNFNANGNAISPFTTDSRTEHVPQTGNKYISIIFTQGITFEINTKIQITQSFHFIPDNNNNKTFGIDLGIGFTLP
jgi:outer membrane protein W